RAARARADDARGRGADARDGCTAARATGRRSAGPGAALPRAGVRRARRGTGARAALPRGGGDLGAGDARDAAPPARAAGRARDRRRHLPRRRVRARCDARRAAVARTRARGPRLGRSRCGARRRRSSRAARVRRRRERGRGASTARGDPTMRTLLSVLVVALACLPPSAAQGEGRTEEETKPTPEAVQAMMKTFEEQGLEVDVEARTITVPAEIALSD